MCPKAAGLHTVACGFGAGTCSSYRVGHGIGTASVLIAAGTEVGGTKTGGTAVEVSCTRGSSVHKLNSCACSAILKINLVISFF